MQSSSSCSLKHLSSMPYQEPPQGSSCVYSILLSLVSVVRDHGIHQEHAFTQSQLLQHVKQSTPRNELMTSTDHSRLAWSSSQVPSLGVRAVRLVQAQHLAVRSPQCCHLPISSTRLARVYTSVCMHQHSPVLQVQALLPQAHTSTHACFDICIRLQRKRSRRAPCCRAAARQPETEHCIAARQHYERRCGGPRAPCRRAGAGWARPGWRPGAAAAARSPAARPP
jgi:hypothetical protein